MSFNGVNQCSVAKSGLVLSLGLALLVSSNAYCDAHNHPDGSARACNQFTQEIGELIASHDFFKAKDRAIKAVSCIRKTTTNSVVLADALRDLAEVYERLGDKESAILNYEQSLGMRSQLVGRDHISCEPVICRLIELHKANLDDAATIPLLERLLLIRKQALSGDCRDIMNPMAELAQLQMNAGTAAEAARTMNSMAETKAAQSGRQNIAVANYKLVAGQASLHAHELKQSENYLKEALQIYTKAGGTPENGACYYFLGQVYDELKLPQRSAASYQSCLDAHKELGDSNSYDYQDALAKAGAAFVKNGQFDDGFKLLNQVLPTYEQRHGKKAHCLEPLLLGLAEYYEHSNDLHKAVAYRSRAAHLDPRRAKTVVVH
jgi:tetratricopeptide (TPR) repeat protein